MKENSRYRGCLLGLACGDAAGTTVDFQPRVTFAAVTEMTGGGPFDLPVGAWTDDTSMALCLATSLVEKQSFDAVDQLNRYVDWYRTRYLSSTGKCFDIGLTALAAIQRFEAGTIRSLAGGYHYCSGPMTSEISPTLIRLQFCRRKRVTNN